MDRSTCCNLTNPYIIYYFFNTLYYMTQAQASSQLPTSVEGSENVISWRKEELFFFFSLQRKYLSISSKLHLRDDA